MKILITGSNGFIGKRLIETWKNYPGVEIFGVSRQKAETNQDVPCLQADILDGDRIREVFSENRFDAVIHLAALTEHEAIVNHRWETFDINLKGTINLLNAFNQYCRGALFLYSSTGKVYGRTNEMPVTEGAYTNPTNILGKSKRITEEVIDFYAVPDNRYLICRIFNIYGEYQKRNFILPTILDQLGSPKVKLGNIRDYRDYLYVDDLVSALWACVEHREKFSNVDYVNIGSGTPLNVVDILSVIEKMVGHKVEVEISDSRKREDETFVEYCDNTKLKAITGWTPQYDIEKGLRKSLTAEGVKCQ